MDQFGAKAGTKLAPAEFWGSPRCNSTARDTTPHLLSAAFATSPTRRGPPVCGDRHTVMEIPRSALAKAGLQERRHPSVNVQMHEMPPLTAAPKLLSKPSSGISL